MEDMKEFVTDYIAYEDIHQTSSFFSWLDLPTRANKFCDENQRKFCKKQVIFKFFSYLSHSVHIGIRNNLGRGC